MNKVIIIIRQVLRPRIHILIICKALVSTTFKKICMLNGHYHFICYRVLFYILYGGEFI